MTAYYASQMEELQTHVKQASHYQQIQIEEQLARSQKTLEMEYSEVQKSFSYERELLMKFEATYCKYTSVSLSLYELTGKKCCWFLVAKFESEFESLQLQYEAQWEAQSKDISAAQESIMAVASYIDEVRRRSGTFFSLLLSNDMRFAFCAILLAQSI